MNAPCGKLVGVGVGPGDPELLTIKALKLIERADVIVYPAPDNGTSFAREIVSRYIDPSSAQVEYEIRIPMRVERFPAQDIYDKAAQDLAQHLNEGKLVVVLCEGDPFFYGSFMYLYERLSKKYRTEVIPGISSMMTLGAMSGRPLAERNDVLTVIPAPLPDADIITILKKGEPCVIIKIGRHFAKIATCLETAGRLDDAIYIERASLANQKIMPVTSVSPDNVPYFSIIQVIRS